jgi:hypothetical protein
MKHMYTIAEVERKLDLGAQWFPIVAAAGYENVLRELEPEEGLLLAGKIMHDPEVNKLSALEEFSVYTDPEYPAVMAPNWKAILGSLGESGRAALRNRINFQDGK